MGKEKKQAEGTLFNVEEEASVGREGAEHVEVSVDEVHAALSVA